MADQVSVGSWTMIDTINQADGSVMTTKEEDQEHIVRGPEPQRYSGYLKQPLESTGMRAELYKSISIHRSHNSIRA